MSKGPGALQRRILDELAQKPSGRILWDDLKQASHARPHSAVCIAPSGVCYTVA